MNDREYVNTTPITCRWTILDLMLHRWGDRSWRSLSRWKHAPNYVSVEYEGGDHGRGVGTVYRFLVDPAVVDELLADGMFEGKKEWGYTEMKELYISARGTSAIEARRTELGWEFPTATMWLTRVRW